jgi:uncharacterized protein
MDISLLLILLALGSCVGFAAGLLGIGGGMLLVPFITMILANKGFPTDLVVKVAIATSLATIVFTSISSVRAHHKRGAVLWPVVTKMAPGILLGSLLGAQLASRISGVMLGIGFSLFVGFSATQMLLNKKPSSNRVLPKPAGLFGVSSGIGALSSLVGAGGGFISVPFLSWCNVSMQNAVATSSALGFPIAFAGTIGYLLAPTHQSLPAGTIGLVYLPALFGLGIASILTAPLGAKAAHALPTATLKKIFAYLLYALAAYMLYKSTGG